MNTPESLQNILNNLILNAKASLGDAKNIALAQAWKLLQLMVAEIIQAIENNYAEIAGKDKKTMAMNCISSFYDNVFVTVTVPFIPVFIQPIIHKYVKSLLMVLVGATIDAMVTTFRNTGIFIPNDQGTSK